MLFWILFVLMIVAIPLSAFIAYFIDKQGSAHPCPVCAIMLGSLLGVLFSILPTLPVMLSWNGQASDYSKVVAQDHRIEVYEERIESLESRLESFDYPNKSKISLDADHPWASMVKALSEAELNLAEAKDEKAIAIRDIEARKKGPMSGVVTLVGDPT